MFRWSFQNPDCRSRIWTVSATQYRNFTRAGAGLHRCAGHGDCTCMRVARASPGTAFRDEA